VTLGSFEPALLRPAPIAVHHNRHVRGHTREVEAGRHGSKLVRVLSPHARGRHGASFPACRGPSS
jgi:hypothetical protein